MSQGTIHPGTKLGHVHLTVTDLDRSLAFYQQTLAFKLHRRTDDSAYLGAGRQDILVLTENPAARKYQGTSGLYHFAVLVPSRLQLAHSLQRMLQTQVPLQGFADHLVSEALYLPDLDGNGIEIYHDRPRSEWPFDNGQLRMATDPLDIEGLLAELDDAPDEWTGLRSDTMLGHIHLHVADLGEAETFYTAVLGFDLMLRFGMAAGFVSAGGYHHHIGFNTWAGQGAPPPPQDAVGLRYFTVLLPEKAALGHLTDRIKDAGLGLEETDEGLIVRDSSQNTIAFTTSESDS